MAQGLDSNHDKNLNERAMATFYNNLKDLYDKHNYKASHVWNADETGCQT
jgi:hypothetical protein